MKKVNLLSKAEMKQLVGGVADCRIAIRNSDGSFRGWSYRDFSVGDAQDAYNDSTTYSDGSYASGYCCASCPF